MNLVKIYFNFEINLKIFIIIWKYNNYKIFLLKIFYNIFNYGGELNFAENNIENEIINNPLIIYLKLNISLS